MLVTIHFTFKKFFTQDKKKIELKKI